MTSGGEACPWPGTAPEAARDLLRRYRVIAVVGCSANPEKPSHTVPQYLKSQGYTIIPVNPHHEGEILGEKTYRSLKDIPAPVEIVEIFRPSQEVPSVVDDAIAIGAKAVWMQSGIIHEEAAARARAAGLTVVMDRCMRTVHQSPR